MRTAGAVCYIVENATSGSVSNVRVLHLAPRLSDRGGADWNLLGLIDGLVGKVDQLLAAGRIEAADLLQCEGREVQGLDARDGQPTELGALERQWRPDIIHVHNVVNPRVLEWAASRRSVLTVQDHRFFCPGRGKWNSKDEVCLRPLDDERCAVCFSDSA